MSPRLSSHDTVFLHWERPWQPMDVGEALVYKGELSRDDLVSLLEARMSLLPRYREKVVFAPLRISHPTWEDDPDFDVRNHVEETWLPAGGGDAEMSVLLGELFVELIDRSRPLWHITVVRGHVSGDTVVVLKLHHSMVDGVSSIEVTEVLHSPAPASAELPATRVRPGSLLLREAIADELDKAVRTAGNVVDLLREGRANDLRQRAGLVARTLRDLAPMLVSKPTETHFNAPITANRHVGWLSLPLEEVHQVRRKLGVTVNDLLLTVLSGAAARGMARTGYPTDGEPLRCMVPWSVRTDSQSGSLGNAVSMVVAPLHVGIDDPQERLEAQQRSMAELKQSEQAAGVHELIALGDYVPAPLYAAIWNLWPRGYFPFNIVSSNVRGPSEPLFLDEHELLAWYPVGVNWTTNGLFLVTISYREHLTLGIAIDPTIVPSLEEVVADFQASYDELRDSVS